MMKRSMIILCALFTFCNSIFGMDRQSAKTQDLWDGQAYDSRSDFQLGIAQEAWKRFFDSNEGFRQYIVDSIASVGCGSGRFELELATRYPRCRFYGIDSSLSQIEHVARNIFSCGVGNIEFHCADAANFKIKSVTEFRFIFSSMMLHWIETAHQQEVVTHMSKQLAPNGAMLIIGLRISDTMTPLGKAFNYVMNLPEYEESLAVGSDARRGLYYVSKNNMEKMCQNAGLKIVYTREYLHEHMFASADEFGKFIRSWVYALPVITRLPEHKRDSFVQCVINSYVENVIKAPRGQVTYSTPLLAIGAVKD